MPPDAVSVSGTRAVPFRGGGFRPRRVAVIGPVVFVVLILLWQVGSQTGFISDVALPSPTAVFGAFRDLVVTGMHSQSWPSGREPLPARRRVDAGDAVRRRDRALDRALLARPRGPRAARLGGVSRSRKIALLPLFVIWFGTGEGSKVATILFGTLFPTVVATYGGIDNVDRNLIRMDPVLPASNGCRSSGRSSSRARCRRSCPGSASRPRSPWCCWSRPR